MLARGGLGAQWGKPPRADVSRQYMGGQRDLATQSGMQHQLTDESERRSFPFCRDFIPLPVLPDEVGG